MSSSKDKCEVSKEKDKDQRKMEYFREVINSTEGKKGKSKPPLGGVYKDVETNSQRRFDLLFYSFNRTTFGLILERENPEPQRKLGFLGFPPITKIDGVNFGSHCLALEEGGRLRITHIHGHKTLDRKDVWKYERQIRSTDCSYGQRRSAQQNRKPSRDFSPREEHQNKFTISLSKQKGQR
ncbi:hypothetical protein F2Q68_00014737 [Brassica cretica]|uniref:Uncharacterized protein n=1 Tax=Brassica cretica TaxID=69181 RepID=A0A8S9HSF6_BRACR|nr:hypothetical protein F2Q68_00014737 [Brassica cretica]